MTAVQQTNGVEECYVKKDFIRNIANKILAEALEKIPASAMSELRKQLGRAEDKYRFTVYGGDPRNLVKYLESNDWRELVEYAEKSNILWVLEKILAKLIEEYNNTCPEVVEHARKELKKLQDKTSGKKTEDISIDVIYRTLKFAGYKVEYIDAEDAVEVKEPYLTVRIYVKEGKIEYTICKSGKAPTLEGIMVKINKIREL